MFRIKMRSLLTLLLTIVLALGLSACGTETGAGEGVDEETDKGTDVTRVSLATAGTSGAWYPIGGGMAQIVNNESNGVEMSAEVTDGDIENVRLLDSDVSQFGFANSDVAYWAYKGIEFFENEGEMNLLGMFNLYPSTFQAVVMEDSGIDSIYDLKGKRVVVGPPASASEIMGWNILNAHGITKDDINGRAASIEEGINDLRDGNIDAVFVKSAHPNSGILDLTSTHDIKLLPIDSDMRRQLADEYTYYRETIIEAGTYKGQDEDIDTLALDSIVLANGDVSEEVAYEFTKSIFENLNEVQEFHDVAKRISLENAPNMPIPLHPGAKKYFEEKDLELAE